MQIRADTVVTIDYKLTDDDGEIIDQSEDEPLTYLHGRDQLVAGLEGALLGHVAGDHVVSVVRPEDGYGEHDPTRVMQVARSELPAELDVDVGLELSTEDQDGNDVTLWVADVDAETQMVTLDANHPLAGMTLHFDVHVREVRAATAEELSHGHAHGPDGHGENGHGAAPDGDHGEN